MPGAVRGRCASPASPHKPRSAPLRDDHDRDGPHRVRLGRSARRLRPPGRAELARGGLAGPRPPADDRRRLGRLCRGRRGGGTAARAHPRARRALAQLAREHSGPLAGSACRRARPARLRRLGDAGRGHLDLGLRARGRPPVRTPRARSGRGGRELDGRLRRGRARRRLPGAGRAPCARRRRRDGARRPRSPPQRCRARADGFPRRSARRELPARGRAAAPAAARAGNGRSPPREAEPRPRARGPAHPRHPRLPPGPPRHSRLPEPGLGRAAADGRRSDAGGLG